MFNNYNNELSLDILLSILNKLHIKTNIIYKKSIEVLDNYLEYQAKELIKYIYELKFESKFLKNENSLSIYDFKQELVRLEKDINYFQNLV